VEVEPERRRSYAECAKCRSEREAAARASAPQRQADTAACIDAERAIVNSPCHDAGERLRKMHASWSYWDNEWAMAPADYAACLAGAAALEQLAAAHAILRDVKALFQTYEFDAQEIVCLDERIEHSLSACGDHNAR